MVGIKKSVLPLILIFTVGTASAQIVDVQSQANKEATEGLSGLAAGSMDKVTGNTHIEVSSASALLRYRIAETTLMLIYKQEYGKKGEEVYTDNSFGHLRLRYDITDLITWELFAQSDHNKFRGYKWRNLVGTGPLLRLIQSKDLTLFTGLAYMREHEVLTKDHVEADGKDEKTTDRLSLAVTYQQSYNDNVSGALSLYYQPSLDDSEDRRLSANASMDIKMNDRLTFFVAASVTEDTVPPQGIKKQDTRVKNGIKIEF